MKYRLIKGTHDVLPQESYQWQIVEQTIHKIMRLFNYKEIRTPIFEETGLFEHGIGTGTDIVGKEMYTFKDRGGTSITLKPEMTASVVRAYIQHNLCATSPIVKVYYISPMFRQERPQAGRLRQFHQFGAEVLGSPHPRADVEIITIAMMIYQVLGVEEMQLRINSIGCLSCRQRYRDVLKKFLEDVIDELSEESKQRINQNPLRVLDSKDEKDREATENAPLMKDFLCAECEDHFNLLQSLLVEVKVPFVVDGRIVRGLDYYTKTAFEITSKDLGSQDALMGGGRYDMLVQALGGKPTPAVGFAGGLERLLMVLKRNNRISESNNNPSVYIITADETARTWALKESINLRRAGISCDVDLLNRSLKSQMREADRQKVKYAIIVGNDEIKHQQVILKDMKSGEQEIILAGDLLKIIQQRLGC